MTENKVCVWCRVPRRLSEFKINEVTGLSHSLCNLCQERLRRKHDMKRDWYFRRT